MASTESSKPEKGMPNKELYTKKGAHSKGLGQKDQEQGFVTAASTGARLTKALYDMLYVRVLCTVVGGWVRAWVL